VGWTRLGPVLHIQVAIVSFAVIKQHLSPYAYQGDVLVDESPPTRS